MAKAKHEHYVNNREFTGRVAAWVKLYKEAKALGEETPPVPIEVAESFYKIAKRYASRPNFSGYTYKEDMIGEALYTCIRYAHNFNSERSDNAFAYFTQCCNNSFLQFIKKEKKFSDLKFNLLKDANSKIGKNDFNDITLFYEDEDNVGLVELDKVEKKMIARQLTPIEELLREDSTNSTAETL